MFGLLLVNILVSLVFCGLLALKRLVPRVDYGFTRRSGLRRGVAIDVSRIQNSPPETIEKPKHRIQSRPFLNPVSVSSHISVTNPQTREKLIFEGLVDHPRIFFTGCLFNFWEAFDNLDERLSPVFDFLMKQRRLEQWSADNTCKLQELVVSVHPLDIIHVAGIVLRRAITTSRVLTFGTIYIHEYTKNLVIADSTVVLFRGLEKQVEEIINTAKLFLAKVDILYQPDAMNNGRQCAPYRSVVENPFHGILKSAQAFLCVITQRLSISEYIKPSFLWNQIRRRTHQEDLSSHETLLEQSGELQKLDEIIKSALILVSSFRDHVEEERSPVHVSKGIPCELLDPNGTENPFDGIWLAGHALGSVITGTASALGLNGTRGLISEQNAIPEESHTPWYSAREFHNLEIHAEKIIRVVKSLVDNFEAVKQPVASAKKRELGCSFDGLLLDNPFDGMMKSAQVFLFTVRTQRMIFIKPSIVPKLEQKPPLPLPPRGSNDDDENGTSDDQDNDPYLIPSTSGGEISSHSGDGSPSPPTPKIQTRKSDDQDNDPYLIPSTSAEESI